MNLNSPYITASSPIFTDTCVKYLLYDLLTGDMGCVTKEEFSRMKLTQTVSNDDVCEENVAKLETYPYLRVQLLPTVNCNFRCIYCGQQHTPTSMDMSIQDAAIKYIESKISMNDYLDGLIVGWFGGEPTLSLEIMDRMTTKLKEICRRHNIVYKSRLCTNGFHLPEKLLLNAYKNYCIEEVNITIDGTKEIHDIRKPHISGKGTFDRILLNIKQWTSTPVKILLRCNVDKRNMDYVPSLIDMLASEGLQEKVFFYIRPVYFWGGNEACQSMSDLDYASYEIMILEHLIKRQFHVELLPRRVYRNCFALDKESVVIAPDGNLYNCDEVYPVSSYQKEGNDKYKIGDIKSGVIDAKIRNKIGGFIEKVKSHEVQCSMCIYYPVCSGLCPLRWIEGHTPCPSYKYNMSERLRLYYEYEYKKNITE